LRQAAGFFRNDAMISGHDITITLPAGAIDERNRYLCPDCKKVVARHFGDQWIVLTRPGFNDGNRLAYRPHGSHRYQPSRVSRYRRAHAGRERRL
jgi:hypothetical protein